MIIYPDVPQNSIITYKILISGTRKFKYGNNQCLKFCEGRNSTKMKIMNVGRVHFENKYKVSNYWRCLENPKFRNCEYYTDDNLK